MSTDILTRGFDDPPTQSARAFRAVLQAMARPGRIETVQGISGPAPLSPAAATVLLTLVDGTTGLHLAGAADCLALRDWIAFHTGAPVVPADQADFAYGTWDALAPLGQYRTGLPDYPDRSATLIVELPTLTGTGARLTGPGIAGHAHLSLPEVAAFRANHARFPLGLDFLFTCGDRLAGLPRSTEVEDI